MCTATLPAMFDVITDQFVDVVHGVSRRHGLAATAASAAIYHRVTRAALDRRSDTWELRVATHHCHLNTLCGLTLNTDIVGERRLITLIQLTRRQLN